MCSHISSCRCICSKWCSFTCWHLHSSYTAYRIGVREVVQYSYRRSVIPFFDETAIGLLLFNALFSIYHMPVVFDYVLTNYGVHRIFHGALVVFSLTMWYPVIVPLVTDEEEGMSDLKRMVYIIANGVLLTPACALIIFSQSTLYNAYTDVQTFATVLGYCMPNGDVSGIDFRGANGATNSCARRSTIWWRVNEVGTELVYGFFFGWTFFGWVRRRSR